VGKLSSTLDSSSFEGNVNGTAPAKPVIIDTMFPSFCNFAVSCGSRVSDTDGLKLSMFVDLLGSSGSLVSAVPLLGSVWGSSVTPLDIVCCFGEGGGWLPSFAWPVTLGFYRRENLNSELKTKYKPSI
jgi:hypothetical protein